MSGCRSGSTWVSSLLLALAVLAHPASAQTARARKTSAEDLKVEVERFTLPNGLTVLLDPDPTVASVLVDMTFLAGSRLDPRGRSGLAHFVEHLLFQGTTNGTGYLELLYGRGARSVEAYTSSEWMMFRTIVPPRELPLALWVAVDRVTTLPKVIDETGFPRHRRVVYVERLLRIHDTPYAKADALVQRAAFPNPHPLGTTTLGTTRHLASISKADVDRFIARYVVASRAVLTISGNFDAATARSWIEKTVAQLPSGRGIPDDEEPPSPLPRSMVLKAKEQLSRRPRVTMLIRLPKHLSWETGKAMSTGAALLAHFTSGSFGTRVSAHVDLRKGARWFRIDLVLPYEKSMRAAADEAEVFLRYLTRRPFPLDYFEAAFLALDIETLYSLDTLQGRASLITGMELSEEGPIIAERLLSAHWGYEPGPLQHAAFKALDGMQIIVHARPLNPVQAKVDWEDREEIKQGKRKAKEEEEVWVDEEEVWDTPQEAWDEEI